MPARSEKGIGQQEARRVRGGAWEVKRVSQETMWDALKSFPTPEAVIEVDITLASSLDRNRSNIQAIKEGIMPNTYLKWSYDWRRNVVMPRSLEFSGYRFGKDLRIEDEDSDEARKVKYARQAEVVRSVSDLMAQGGRIDTHNFNLTGRGGLGAFREQKMEDLKARGYQFESARLTLNERYDWITSGMEFSRFRGQVITLTLDQRDLYPEYKNEQPGVLLEDARKLRDWIEEIKTSVKTPVRPQTTV